LIAGTGYVVDIDKLSMQQMVETLVAHLGLSGFCGFDFLISDAGSAFGLGLNHRVTPIMPSFTCWNDATDQRTFKHAHRIQSKSGEWRLNSKPDSAFPNGVTARSDERISVFHAPHEWAISFQPSHL
jgi:hypothetical protein